MKWQPMVTAPFDTEVLCQYKNGGYAVLFKNDRGLWDDGNFDDCIKEKWLARWAEITPPTPEELEAINGNETVPD